jgi:hypothetical protein
MSAIDPVAFAQALAEVRALTPTTDRHAGYVPTGKRVRAWADMAVDLAAQGRSVAEIAAALCVSEDTAARLLGRDATGRAAA